MSFIVNLYGSPGAGKSTTRAELFYRLKIDGYNVEEVTEFAKDLTWEERKFTLGCQPYILGKQLRNIERVINKVECVITDSPLLLSAFYTSKYAPNRYPESFLKFTLDASNIFPQNNYYIKRQKAYNPVGRNQTEAQSNEIASELLQLMQDCGIVYQMSSVEDIFTDVKRRLDDNRRNRS